MQRPDIGTDYEPLLRVLEEAADAISLVRPDGSKYFANRRWCELLDYEMDDLRAAPTEELIHPGDRKWTMDGLANGVDISQRFRALGRRRSVVPVTACPIALHNPSGTYLGQLSITRPSGPRRFAADEAADLKRRAGALGGALVPALPGLTAPTRSGVGVDDPLAQLTSREREIALLLADAAVPKEIAFDLDISVHTARNHIKAIYRKLDLHSHQELMLRCLREGA